MNRTNGTMNQAWTLSDVGNWDAFTSAGSTWNRTHSNAHEFTGFTGASTGTLTYDVKGNQTSRPSTLSAPALNLYWNFDNQLVGADTNGSAGSLEVTFEYDALGRRVSRSHSSGNVVYVHAGQQVIADYARGTAAASPSYRYVYADYVDEPILRHSGTGTTLPTTGDNALYFHRNQQYSIIGLTNAAGTLVERYSYTAYGTLGNYDASGTVRTTSTYANRYTYTGREYDPDLNLYHFRARWYDPGTGGFISRDPLGYVDGMSLYRGYFGVKGTDPFGLLLTQVDNNDSELSNFEHIQELTGFERTQLPIRFVAFLKEKKGRLCVNVHSSRAFDKVKPYVTDMNDDEVGLTREEIFRRRWNKFVKGRFDGFGDMKGERGIEGNGWFLPNLALCYDGCDETNQYGGSYWKDQVGGEQVLIGDDDYVEVVVKAFGDGDEPCNIETTKCWHPMGKDASRQEGAVVHATGSEEVCIECNCPIKRIQVFVRYVDHNELLMSGGFSSDENGWNGKNDDNPLDQDLQ